MIPGPFRTCFPPRCIVEIDLPAETLAQLQAGGTASVFMTAVTGQSVKTDLSLKCFSAAHKRLLALPPDNDQNLRP
ncbi:invasion associated locus B family protein [Aestuariivirga sp. YIM B02566]|uniref:Invasion associated locus B family protein n=1 Tax=Taklimakanibacter albus TaxID=2800327 RepID=A0ACC5R929_9HYPH|nr:invasion associated locus B family protein [Aestuariivirga sp. YIM B02566]MBK1869189.1 invasion associated locus B family protein [Aestuariivirga sp. YIM B02566]